ncbi:MAG: hypothetical protein V4608_15470 [Bacteroidota bacterium]
MAIAALILGGALVYVFFFSLYAITKRKLFKTNNGIKISSFQNGEVAKTVGKVKYIGKPLVAPLSGRNCAYYHVLVQEKIRVKHSISYWHTLIEERVGNNLVIKDGNYYAFVETSRVKSYLTSHIPYTSGFGEAPTKQMENYLLKYGYESKGGIFKRNNWLRYKEGIIEEGEVITVVGKGIWKRKSEIQLKIPSEKILIIESLNDQVPVFFSNDPNLKYKLTI